MAKYAISQEGAAELQKLSKSLITNTENIFEAGVSLKNSLSSCGEGLGLYEDEILTMVNHNQTVLQTNRDTFKVLSDTLAKKADDICGLLGLSSNGYTGASNNHTQGSNQSNQFVPLLSTAQGFEEVMLNGKDVKIFDHPFDYDSKHNICNQGSAFPTGPQGTCGNCASGSIMNKAGFNYSEKDVISYALSNNLCTLSGGTSPEDWVDILNGMSGIKSTASRTESLEDLASKVEEGKGVIIGVNAKLYKEDWYGPYDPNNAAGHALVLDSVVRDKNTGEILEYVVTDSNGDSQRDACQRVSKNILERAYYAFGKKSVVTNDVIW